MAKQLKLKCVETYNSTWRFTRGKEYPLMGNLKEDPHVISDNGLHLYLMEYNDGYIGAGVPGHKFKMKNKKLGYLFSKMPGWQRLQMTITAATEKEHDAIHISIEDI